MIKLYYAPFSCSMTIHIVLEMLGADYEAIRVKVGSDEYKQIAYKGAVPAIIDYDTSEEVMTQIPALLNYLLEKFNNKDLGSDGTLKGNYEFNNAIAFINSDLHKAFGASFASGRFTTKTDEETINSIKEAGFKIIERQLGFLEQMLNGKKFILGERITAADIYAFVVSNWANGLLPTKLENYPNIRKLHEEITKLESVQKIIGIHQS